jgi:UDPglucose--hexose-1-phosphate uridylyltransferase
MWVPFEGAAGPESSMPTDHSSAMRDGVHKRSLVKPDGRKLHLYSRQPIPSDIVGTNPHHEPVTNEPHLRYNPLRDEWVAYASHRQNRTFLPPKEYNPLLPSTSPDFPTELPPGAYDVAVFENLFSSLTPTATQAPEAYVETRPGQGACEVVVFTQNPDASLGGLAVDHIELLLKVWADRTSEIGGRGEVHYVMPFENKGVEVGVTLHHPHGQIYAYPFVPPVVAKMAEAQSRFREAHGRGLIEHMIEEERRAGTRMIHDDGHTTAFIPVCARYPYEVWICPARRVGFIQDLGPDELRSLARTLKTVLLKYDGLWNKPFPYLMVLYQAPTDGEDNSAFHFHIEFFPPLRTPDRLKYLAGTELGGGMFVNDALPEEKAAELQKVPVSLDPVAS